MAAALKLRVVLSRPGNIIESHAAIGADLPLDCRARGARGRHGETDRSRTNGLRARIERHHRAAVQRESRRGAGHIGRAQIAEAGAIFVTVIRGGRGKE